MGTSLFNTTPQATYPSLIKLSDNLPLTATFKALSDGLGNDSVLALSTISLQIGGATGATWDNTNKRLGIGTTTPVGILHLYKAAAATRLAIDGDAGQNRLISYRTGALQRFGLYVNNTAESGSNVGSDFAIRAYNDAGTLLSTPLFIKRSTGDVGIGTTTPLTKLHVAQDVAYSPSQSGQLYVGGATTTNKRLMLGYDTTLNYGFIEAVNFGTAYSNLCLNPNSANVGIGTTAPQSILDVRKLSTNLGTTSELGLLISNTGVGGQYSQIGFGYSEGTCGAVISGLITSSAGATNSALVFATRTSTIGSDAPTERMRITSAGNVGIGTATPTDLLEVKRTGDGNVLTISTTATSSQINIGVGVVTSGRPFVGTNTNTNPLEIGTRSNTDMIFLQNSAEIARITANGLTFNGDTAAANALDDYEEGTWTMGVTFGGGSTGITYGSNLGTYTKIGRQVTVNGYLVLTNKGSSTGNAKLTGLPFTIPSGVQNYSSSSLFFENITFLDNPSMIGGLNTTTIEFYQILSTTGVITALTNTNFSNSSGIIVSFTYFV